MISQLGPVSEVLEASLWTDTTLQGFHFPPALQIPLPHFCPTVIIASLAPYFLLPLWPRIHYSLLIFTQLSTSFLKAYFILLWSCFSCTPFLYDPPRSHYRHMIFSPISNYRYVTSSLGFNDVKLYSTHAKRIHFLYYWYFKSGPVTRLGLRGLCSSV